MDISNYLRDKILDLVFNGVSLAPPAQYISLHSGDPGLTGASEIAGGSYTRLAGSFGLAGAVTPNQVDSDAALNFTDMPGVTLTHVGMWDAASAGNFLWRFPLSSPKTVNAGDTFSLAIGDLEGSLA